MLASMDHFNNTERVMVANVPVQRAFTVYPYIGDLFGWLAMAGFVFLVVLAIAWGCFLIMLGGFMFVPQEIVNGGWWSIGVGLSGWAG